ncbi:MAG: hypothetical protein C4539_18175 [Ignavibacteriales bacterium]|nr:MAG: hypothetical protein C4539_18175 [Ignavibacteriales bacterium]
MKSKNILALLLGFISYCILYNILFSYDNKKAQPAINDAIIKHIEAHTSDIFPDNYKIKITAGTEKYSGMAVTNYGYFDISTSESEVEYTIFEWIKHGGLSADEPELAAAVRHFYDPLGLYKDKKHLTNRGTYWEGVYGNPQTDAIEWALGDTEKGESNKWTLKKGKEYMQNAIELASESMKATNLAKAFRCLGEVLHNTGDMGCPPHTRNDSHAAPWGYTGGAVLGSPDPYEEMFSPGLPAIYINSDPDPELKTFFEGATTIRSINEKLAEFTNTNFFSEQTINGIGQKEIKPVNEECTYPSPLLQNLEYNAENFTYYKTFPSGRKVKMCRDRGYFSSRKYPYIDYTCVNSQADELVTNILCAGANVFRLFIPKLEVKITEYKADGTVKGTVTHTTTPEYSTEIYYSGKIHIYNAKTEQKITTLDCNTGDFTGSLSSVSVGDEIYADLEIADIHICSYNFKIPEQSLVSINPATFSATLNGKYSFNAIYDGQLPSSYKCYWWANDKDNNMVSFTNSTEFKYQFKKEGSYKVYLQMFDITQEWSNKLGSAECNVTVTRGPLSDLYAQESFSFSLDSQCEFDDTTYNSDHISLSNSGYSSSGSSIEWNGVIFSSEYNFKWQGSVPVVGDTFYVSGKLYGTVSDDGKKALTLWLDHHVKHNRSDYKYDLAISLADVPIESHESMGSVWVGGSFTGTSIENYIKSIYYKATFHDYYTQKWMTINIKKLVYNEFSRLSISFL